MHLNAYLIKLHWYLSTFYNPHEHVCTLQQNFTYKNFKLSVYFIAFKHNKKCVFLTNQVASSFHTKSGHWWQQSIFTVDMMMVKLNIYFIPLLHQKKRFHTNCDHWWYNVMSSRCWYDGHMRMLITDFHLNNTYINDLICNLILCY